MSYKDNAKKRRFSHLHSVLCVTLLPLVLAPAGSFASVHDAPAKPPLRVTASVDKSKANIGDKITYTLTVKTDKGIEVELPEFAQNLGGFAVKDFGSLRKGWFKTRTYRQWYLLDTYTSGKYLIPAAVIKYREKGQKEWQEALSEGVSVEVESILENAEDKRDIRGIFGPLSFPFKGPWYLWAATVLIVLCLSFAFFLCKQKKRKEAFVPPFRPAHEIAYEALAALKEKGYLEDKEFKLYYIELSDIVRKYLENRFSLRAPQMSTEEFLNGVRENKALSPEQKSLLGDFLSHCDLVKFAKYEPPEEEADLSFAAAKKLIDQTKEEGKEEAKG